MTKSLYALVSTTVANRGVQRPHLLAIRVVDPETAPVSETTAAEVEVLADGEVVVRVGPGVRIETLSPLAGVPVPSSR